MAEVSQEVANRLNDFEKTKNLDALVKASELIENMNGSKRSDLRQFRAARLRKLNLWLAVLNHIDKETDPHFNPADVPFLTVPPPSIPGVVLDSGISPKDIKDPQARRRCEEAIEQNRKKTQRYNYQYDLMKMNEKLSRKVEAYILSSYSGSPDDVREVTESVDKYLQNEKRRTRLKKLASREIK